MPGWLRFVDDVHELLSGRVWGTVWPGSVQHVQQHLQQLLRKRLHHTVLQQVLQRAVYVVLLHMRQSGMWHHGMVVLIASLDNVQLLYC